MTREENGTAIFCITSIEPYNNLTYLVKKHKLLMPEYVPGEASTNHKSYVRLLIYMESLHIQERLHMERHYCGSVRGTGFNHDARLQ